jgi:2-dehydro-3-deoxyphosphooctonate aldolase (KDO 8-P synthase)
LQLPGGLGDATGGQSEYIEPLARAGVACGVDAVFMEVHEQPERALSDGPNALPLDRMQALLNTLRDIHGLVKT